MTALFQLVGQTMIDHEASKEFLQNVMSLVERRSPKSPTGFTTDQERQYIREAVEEGRFGKNVISNLFKGLMGETMAAEYSDAFVSRLFHDYAPVTPGERLLIENLAVLHGQLMMVRARWAIATDLDDVEKLTRVQARLAAEMAKVMTAIADERGGPRPVFQQVNVATNQQILTQNVLTNEVRHRHA